MKTGKIAIASLAMAALFQLSACNGDSKPQNETPTPDNTVKPANSGHSNLLKVGDKLFNLPSPLETAFLIEKVDKQYNESMLNQTVDATKYTTKFAQSMNLGVYGADLGYALIHNQSQSAFKLLGVCKKLGTELGISPALYTGLMSRFEGNLENKDSLLIFVSELNRLSDEYLKENEAEDVSALILYGGWIESLHFTTTLATSTGQEEIIKRVGEQKNGLNNLIGLISQQNGNGALDPFLKQLKELKTIFNKVEYNYTWQEPVTKPDQKLTILKSTSSVNISEDVLNEIAAKTSEIRQSIIETTSL